MFCMGTRIEHAHVRRRAQPLGGILGGIMGGILGGMHAPHTEVRVSPGSQSRFVLILILFIVSVCACVNVLHGHTQARTYYASKCAAICTNAAHTHMVHAPPCHQAVLCLERIPFGLRVFDFPHITVFVRFSPTINAFSRRFSGSPTNPRILNVRFSYSSVDFPARFSIFTTGMLRQNPNFQPKRNLLYAHPFSLLPSRSYATQHNRWIPGRRSSEVSK